MTKEIINNQNIGITTIVYPTTKKTVHFKSQSEPGVVYTTMRARTGKVVCTCPGFLWRQTCRHCKRVASYKN